ncbi:MAG TPA: hypothetical protein PK867_31110, partial [Pirellulales bacterium]|nr:hypothetical protein [Pirellulales bacterium]
PVRKRGRLLYGSRPHRAAEDGQAMVAPCGTTNEIRQTLGSLQPLAYIGSVPRSNRHSALVDR